VNNFTKTLVGACLAGAAILAVSVPASASATAITPASSANATANEAAAGDRVKGPFWTWTSTGHGHDNQWSIGAGGAVEHGAGDGTVWTFPAPGNTGQVRPVGSNQCLTRLGNNAEPVGMRTCNGSAAQNIRINADGTMWVRGPYADGAWWAFTDHGSHNKLTTMSQGTPMNYAEQLRMEKMTPVVDAKPVDITGPGAGSTHEDTTPTFSGTGEPGATVVLKDADGNTIATTTVDGDGTWAVDSTVDLPEGPQTITAEQTVDGTTTTDSVDIVITADDEDTPIIAPVIGLGALVAAGGAFALRRKLAQA
jgi:hypothetical protein